jgi:mRNA interferase MazF
VNNSKNGLDKKSYALVHQLCTIDGSCFKKSNGDWLERIGQLQSKDRDKIEERLKYLLGLSSEPTDDWFQHNASPELLRKIYGYMPDSLRIQALEELVDGIE